MVTWRDDSSGLTWFRVLTLLSLVEVVVWKEVFLKLFCLRKENLLMHTIEVKNFKFLNNLVLWFYYSKMFLLVVNSCAKPKNRFKNFEKVISHIWYIYFKSDIKLMQTSVTAHIIIIIIINTNKCISKDRLIQN